MGKYKEVKGDLILLGLGGKFDVIAQGNNCFCTQAAGLAPQMVAAFGTDKYEMENPKYKGDINKLGTIDYESCIVKDDKELVVINCYSQFGLGINHAEGQVAPLDYAALELCLKKINHIFKGKHWTPYDWLTFSRGRLGYY